ncbi:MAG TPA: M14 family zinc carboxypeptidase [Anaerolineales bacterium]|nr:M14 family zinc carboxypeptidase [Anaerolineales bacterium]
MPSFFLLIRTRSVAAGTSLVLLAFLAGIPGRGPRAFAAVQPPTATPASTIATPSASPTPATLSAPAPLVIGASVAGRPLEAYRFGEGRSRRMMVAGIHGGYEWNTIALADELIAYLAAHPHAVPPERTLYILRALNPDGEARGHGPEGRANDNGVDLNRNWPVNWLPSWPGGGCWGFLEITPGRTPVSEPETRALMHFAFDTELDALISYHSAALGIFPGGSPPDPASARLAEAIAAEAPYPYPPIETGCIYSGTLPDWAAASGIPAVDLELSTHWGTDFEVNLRILETFLAWEP